MYHPRVVLLGPQRLQPTLNQVVDSLGILGNVAVVTAGWEERESEDQELRDHLGGRTMNLRIYERVEEIMQSDPELARGLRERADRLRAQNELYRLRLAHALEAAREIMRRETGPESLAMLETEREAAIEAVRTLDRFHARQAIAIHSEFEQRYQPLERESVARHRREIARTLASTQAVCIAGGHVTVLLHRLRLFDVLALIGQQPILAWSAGAMVLSEFVVLFHDSPPQGVGHAELYDIGLGAYPDLVPLPHAKKRLRLHDALRVSLFSRRFAPAQCVTFDPLTRMDWDGRRWHAEPGTLRLHERGQLVQAGAP